MIKNDPQRYAEMSRPFETTEAAEEAIKAFEADLYELRCKHRIRDLSIVGAVSASDSEGQLLWVQHIGAEGNEIPMLAYGYGTARREALARIAGLDVAITGGHGEE